MTLEFYCAAAMAYLCLHSCVSVLFNGTMECHAHIIAEPLADSEQHGLNTKSCEIVRK